MNDQRAISPNHGKLTVPSNPKVKSNFLSMKPSDMFKMIGVLGTQTQLGNRAETRLRSSNGNIPEQLHEANFSFNTEPEPELPAEPATAQWREGVRISEETIPKRVTVGLKPTAVQSTRAGTSPLTRVELRHLEAIQYSRKDVSSLDGTFPLDLPPNYKGFEIQTLSGSFSGEVTDCGPEITTHRSTKAVSPAPRAKEPFIPAWDGMLSSTNPKPTPSVPKLKVADIPPSRETLPKKAFSSGFQLQSVQATEFVTPPTIIDSNKVSASAESLFKKPAIPSLGINLGPEVQIPKPVPPPKRAQKVTKFNETSTKNPNRSDRDISPDIVEKPARGGSGYSFVKGSRFPAVAKVGKVNVKTLEPAILKPVVTNNPEFDSQERMASWRKDYETNSVKAIAPSFQVEIMLVQNRTREDPFTKVNPIVGLSAEIKSSESTEARNISNTSLPTLPYEVEESDLSRSSSDEEGERVKEATPFEDVALVSSKPWVKRITARRRMRQGEFLKW